MFSFIYGPASSGKTEYAKQLQITNGNNYSFINAADYTDKNDINDILTACAASKENAVIDNAHLLKRENVEVIRNLVDRYDIDIKATGLRSDSNKELFEGSRHLFALCDTAVAMEVYCECGCPAVFSVCVDTSGSAVLYGEQVDTKAIYKPVCSKCYTRYIEEAKAKESLDMIRELNEECGI